MDSGRQLRGNPIKPGVTGCFHTDGGRVTPSCVTPALGATQAFSQSQSSELKCWIFFRKIRGHVEME